jgi:tetratricopeptide (TPR) repeat protein
MKRNLILLIALFMSVMVMAQKNELKEAERAIKANDFDAALAAVNSAEGMIANADQKTKAKFYYLKGMALYRNGDSNADFAKVGKAFNELMDYERATNKPKYTNEISTLINALVASAASKASVDYTTATASKKPEDYVAAAKGFEIVYLLSPTDTAFLDNAALIYFVGEDFNKSIALYQQLKDMKYTGVATIYVATNKETQQDVTYNDQKSMDLQVKLGLVENPRVEKKESRRSIVFKNLAQNYVNLENNEKALAILEEGRKEFPSSYSLLIDEANIHFKMDNHEMFKQRLEEAVELNPTEPTLYYNIGVMNLEQGNTDEAIRNFKKAIEYRPDYGDAYNNIGAAIIEKAEPIIEEMNNSLADFDKYDKLQAQQLEIYREAVPFYEKAYEFNSTSLSIIQTLMGLYENLEMTEKYEEIKSVYDGLR